MAGKNLFNSVKMTKPGKNVFDLSHDVKLSARMGELVPTMVLECIPGDKFTIGCDSLLRFAPLVAPVMHRVDVSMHYFFVPNRILWSNWEKFITNTGNPTLVPAHPTLTMDETTVGNLQDYMGIPTADPGSIGVAVNALPFAAYQCIWNEYYRDQNLQPEIFYQLVDGNNDLNTDLAPLRLRAWEHDYFTSALPFAQKGAAVDIPLGDVTLDPDWGVNTARPHMEDATGGPQTGALSGTATPAIQAASAATDLAYNPEGSLHVEATTINDLRRAFRLQEWLEKAARGGSRYVENILSFFGVRSPDKRLQRPEYITGTKSPVIISEVLNTSDTVDAPQGNMAGHAVSVTQGQYGGYFCEEHGFIIGIMSVMPKPAYQQGIARHFLKNDTFSYYWPQFANIGEQEIQNVEVFAYHPDQLDTFGYIPRYSEYKYMQNRVAGQFRSTLAFWHIGRIFATLPALNEQFIECAPRTDIFAVAASEQLYCHILHKIRAVRPMPKYGTPTF